MTTEISLNYAFSMLLEDIDLELTHLSSTKHMVEKMISIFEKVAAKFSEDKKDADFYRKTLGVLIKLKQSDQILEGKIAALSENRNYYQSKQNNLLKEMKNG